ncbi:hypothetical protein F5B21DRAFT_497767 [Xylaria acuta]|nr:hypothetical protein F5B21DRAFT_497767 [Xylaria acuta]
MDTGLNTSASQGDQYPVYVGVWTNWSRGQVMGSTLTLRRRDADLLIAFTAFFIAFITTRAWRILCFMFHRFYSTPDPRDAIYHQRQTILRNSSSPESGIQMLLWLLWANRRSKGWFRSLPAAIVAIMCVSIFTIAGGFSSQISTAVGNEVLIKGANCGYIPPGAYSGNPFYFLQLSDAATKLNSAANYAQQCYSSENTGLLDCGRFTIKRVANKIDTQARCPFKNRLCRNESANLRIDSGYIDSHDSFGMNAPPAERILFRKVLHCAPLITTGFTHEKITSLGRLTLYQYGNYIGADSGEINYVHAAQSVEHQYSVPKSDDIAVAYANYALSPYISTVKNETIFKAASSFDPIDEIARKDADIYLFFLSGNGVAFAQPSDDQWYHLNTTPSSFNHGVDKPVEIPLYVPQDAASPLSCTIQYQFCNTAFQGRGGCGPLASLRDAAAGAAPFFDTTYAEYSKDIVKSETGALYAYFMNTFFSSSPIDIHDILKYLGPTGLASQKTLNAGIQGPVASNQWQHDVSHWWDVSMAAQQSVLVDTAYVRDNSDILATRFIYTAPEFRKLCNNQKIRSSAHASFSLFGLFFTLTVGLLLILVSYLLEPICEWFHKRNGYNQYPYLEWVSNATLQLQRLAHEEAGFGTWSEGTKTIPMVKAGQLLGSLDTTDPRHPVLRQPMNGDGVPLSAEDSAETPNTMISDGSQHTDMTPEPSIHAYDAEQEINGIVQGGLASDEAQVEGHKSTRNLGMLLLCDDAPLSETAEPCHSE